MFLLDGPVWAAASVGSEIEVGGSEGRHAVTVVRLRPGESVQLGGGGRRASAVVTQTGRDAFVARVLTVHEEPEPDPRFILVQALAKAGRDEQAIETATELGVDEVVPWQAKRSVVEWRGVDRSEKGRRRWEAVVMAATKQSRRTRIPVVAPLLDLGGAVERVRRAASALVLHEEGERPLMDVDVPTSGNLVLVVGPEGGITPEELDAFAAEGGQPVRLGPEVLRSSTAGPAALAVLSARSRWR
jgi:16S rRNA (uracil1498-N3)-methyltransferase